MKAFTWGPCLMPRDSFENCMLVQLPADTDSSSEVSLPDLLPLDSVLGQNYWQSGSFTG